MGSTPTTGTNLIHKMQEPNEKPSEKLVRELADADPLKTGLIAFLVTVFLSRLVGFLVIDAHALPLTLFVDIHGYRLHHFVYGDLIIAILGFVTFFLEVKLPKGIGALLYGIGLGLVMDEFVLWLGSMTYLSVKSFWVFNTTNSVAVISIAAIMMILIWRRSKTQKSNDV